MPDFWALGLAAVLGVINFDFCLAWGPQAESLCHIRHVKKRSSGVVFLRLSLRVW